jgi:hypothetical protein
MKNALPIIAIIFLLGVWGSGAADARTPDAQTVTTSTAAYDATSPEGRQIMEWLKAHEAPSKQGLFEDSDSKGEFRLSIRTVHGGTSGRAGVGGEPTVLLPSGGADGEAIVVAHTGDGVTETWTYAWDGNGQGGWSLTYYAFRRGAPPASAP